MDFNGGRRRGRAVVINSSAGVDACILRQEVTDLQQDVPSVPAEEAEDSWDEEQRDGKGKTTEDS